MLKIKKHLSLIMAIMMIFCALSITSFATDSVVLEDGKTYSAKLAIKNDGAEDPALHSAIFDVDVNVKVEDGNATYTFYALRTLPGMAEPAELFFNSGTEHGNFFTGAIADVVFETGNPAFGTKDGETYSCDAYKLVVPVADIPATHFDVTLRSIAAKDFFVANFFFGELAYSVDFVVSDYTVIDEGETPTEVTTTAPFESDDDDDDDGNNFIGNFMSKVLDFVIKLYGVLKDFIVNYEYTGK